VHDLKTALAGSALPGPARGAAYQLSEAGAALDRRHGDPLGVEDRAALQAIGVKSGRIAAWLPGLLKPAAAQLTMTLRSVHSGMPAPPAPSSASFALAGQAWPDAMLQAAGYLRLGPRAVRADMAERLSWLLGQARRGSETSTFTAAPELAAQIGCPIAEFPDVLRALGLKPAERHPETNAVTRWRFASQKTAQRRNDRKRETATATGPFAALAALTTQAPTAPRRRRRHRTKAAQAKSAQAKPVAQ
jgi:ATP-dependent RNA helicase SUPV3L1/SUV3